ncbi:MAG: hypothetical protein GF384_05980 [Elusimicrobia bacterium]|nr:hypothetical protein [Elusimicrobiota bacterium]MBD3412297.1 hypothetical protein [Elusimicrobiota bacterium]
MMANILNHIFALIEPIIYPRSKKQAWFHVIVFIGFIYATLGLVRPISTLLKQYHLMGPVVAVCLIILALVYARIIIKHKAYRLTPLLAIGLISALYGASLVLFVVQPEERIHFVEYGIVAILLLRAFSFSINRRWIAFGASLGMCTALGYIDELIQYVLPNRVYDLRDVGLNAFSGLLSLFFMLSIEKYSIDKK